MTSNQTDPAEKQLESDPDIYEYKVPGTERIIHLKRPTEPQVAVLLRLQSMFEDAPLEGAQLYMDALGAMMLPEDEQWCLRMLLRGTIGLDVFTHTAMECLFYFYPELKKAAEEAKRTAQQHGPATRRRARR